MDVLGSRVGVMMAGANSNTAAAGLILANSIPLNVTSIGAPAGSVYLVTLTEGIGAACGVPMVTVKTAAIASSIMVAQATALTFNVTGSADTIFSFGVWRTAVQAV